MTREEAIEILDHIPTIGEQVDAIDMAIDALYHHTEKTDNISTKVKSDLISRADAIERLKYHTDFIKDRNYADGEELLYKESAIAQINALPTADRPSMIPIKLEKRYPQSKDEDITDAFMRGYMQGISADRPTGEWIIVERGSNENGFTKWNELKCPFCGHEPVFEDFDDMNYCPNCGAKMEGPDHGDR